MLSTLNFDLEKCWTVEEVNPVRTIKSEELQCAKIFKDHVTRDENGRYVVPLPFEDKYELGESRSIAEKRLLSLKKKFKNNKEFEMQYENGMNEYLKASHITLIDKKDENAEGFYIPHLPVIKESSNTTKFRIVFESG